MGAQNKGANVSLYIHKEFNVHTKSLKNGHHSLKEYKKFANVTMPYTIMWCFIDSKMCCMLGQNSRDLSKNVYAGYYTSVICFCQLVPTQGHVESRVIASCQWL